MPIVPAFDPATGASGGPSSGGGTTGGWVQITDLSTLTFSDPNSLVVSQSSTNGLHSVTTATLGASNVDYNFGSGANFTGARWTFPLTYGDGSPVQAQDAFSFQCKVTDFSVGAARNYNFGFAVTQNATSTVLSTMDACGPTFGTTGVGTPLCGTWRRNVVGTTSLAGGTVVYGDTLFGGVPGKVKVGAQAVILGAATGSPTSGLDANAWSVADATQLSAILALGTLGTVTTTGGQVDFKLFVQVLKLS
jgi:hypothetical protein